MLAFCSYDKMPGGRGQDLKKDLFGLMVLDYGHLDPLLSGLGQDNNIKVEGCDQGKLLTSL